METLLMLLPFVPMALVLMKKPETYNPGDA